jgi:hypothetical protein
MVRCVQCVNCGLLAIRHSRTNELHEVDALRRENWKRPYPSSEPPVQNATEYSPVPVCFVRAANLPDEVGKAPYDDRVSTVVLKERDCKQFEPWQQGYLPREHQDMILTREMLARQRQEKIDDKEYRDKQREQDQKREDGRLKDDREYRENQREQDFQREEKRLEEDRKYREGIAKKEGRRFWINLGVTVLVAFLTTAVTILTTVVTLYGPSLFNRSTQQTDDSAKQPPPTVKADVQSRSAIPATSPDIPNPDTSARR